MLKKTTGKIWQVVNYYLLLQNKANLINIIMKHKLYFLLLSVLLCCATASAQQVQKNEQHQRAEAEEADGKLTAARYMYIRAFESYLDKGQTRQGVECGTKATALYYKDNLYHEAFELARRIDQGIDADRQASASEKSALHYMTARERLQMYIRLRKPDSARDQLAHMERHLSAAPGDESLANDLLYQKTIYYYSFGKNSDGDAVLGEMVDKLTSSKEYDKVAEAYRTLIANGRRAGSVSMVAQSYSSYMAWNDSVTALKHAEEVDSLKQQITTHEATIADKDSSLSSRSAIIIGLCILAAILAGVLVFGGIVLMRFIMQTRKQKNTIKELRENNALKAKFLNNIASQLTPSLQKLDGSVAEVRALKDFASHIETLAELDSLDNAVPEKETVQVQSFCEQLMEEIRGKVKKNVELIVTAPKLNTTVNKEYVTHILRHLLSNAAIYTPEGGHVTLEFRKRSAHTQQFLVLDTGCGIPVEKREDVFKPFLEIRDLSQGDGLGLPICKTMAQKMDGDLSIDPTFNKGTRFILDLRI